LQAALAAAAACLLYTIVARIASPLQPLILVKFAGNAPLP
jgi:hypothetical protein